MDVTKAAIAKIKKRRSRAEVLGPVVVVLLLEVSFAATAARADEPAPPDLSRLSIEDLAHIDITSVSKSAEPLSDAPAAIYVISHDDIMRSGATSIPEILRLAPNLQVAAITASSYAISARGFNGSIASKLLVLIDGRSVYSPLHSGVFWDMQEVLPEDIDRIEVISGPGATLWGANAVNGVINIITRKSSDTQGGVAELGGGNQLRRGDGQYGGSVGHDVTYRAYVDAFQRGDDHTATGLNAKDGWHNAQGGFRTDWAPSGELVTLQGDAYDGSERELSGPNTSISGRNLIGRWTHQMDGGSALQLQAYYDYASRVTPNSAADSLNTYDLDLQHSFSWGTWQQMVWGGGYRVEQDYFTTVLSSTQSSFFQPQKRTLSYGNVFVQDTVSLAKSLKLILGTKLEKDAYVRPELLPSIRLSWKVTDTDLLWSAVSRAVRAPSRLDRDLFASVGSTAEIVGGDFQSEKLIAYEVGYRAQPITSVSISVSTFYNVYDDLRSAEFLQGSSLPIVFANRMEGDTYGVEVWGNYQATTWWRLTTGFNWLHENLRFQPGSSMLGGIALAGDDPAYQFSIRSSFDITHDVAFDLDLRDIGKLKNPQSSAYTELNARIGWSVTSFLELSLVGSNLFHPHHLEFGTTSAPLQIGATGVEMGRSFFGNARLRF
jgi:iron complex outermembrane receptor protein